MGCNRREATMLPMGGLSRLPHPVDLYLGGLWKQVVK
jgi:hypothetical protein